MKRILEQIIDKNTEGNYLLSSSDKAQIISEILDLFGNAEQSEQQLKNNTQTVNLCFSSEEELDKHIQMHMPFAVRPTKKAKTVFVNPFTSHNARELCISSIVKSLLK